MGRIYVSLTMSDQDQHTESVGMDFAELMRKMHTFMVNQPHATVHAAVDRPVRVRRETTRMLESRAQNAQQRAHTVPSDVPDARARKMRRPPAMVMAPQDQDAQRDSRKRNIPAGFEPASFQQAPAPALFQAMPHDASSPDDKATRREQLYHCLKNQLQRMRFKCNDSYE